MNEEEATGGAEPTVRRDAPHQTPIHETTAHETPTQEAPAHETMPHQTMPLPPQSPGVFYPQNPGYGPPQAPFYAPPPQPAPKPSLSNTIGLASIGIMSLIAAVGLWVMMYGFNHDNVEVAGKAILIATGLIVVTTSLVLGYAALKGLRPGWFLWFSVTGATLLVPVLMGGASLMVAGGYDDYGPYGYGFEDEYSTEIGWIDDDQWELDAAAYDELLAGDRDYSATWLNPTDTDISVSAETVILDLTKAPKGEDLNYDADLDASTLYVLLTPKQLPLIETANMDDTSEVRGAYIADAWEYEDPSMEIFHWSQDGYNPSNFPLEGPEAAAANQMTFNLELEASTVVFVVADQDAVFRAQPGDEDVRPDSTSVSQSGDQKTTSQKKDETK